jgi:MoaA/NifB/PqqE/SkfB family radical SAM enzyme
MENAGLIPGRIAIATHNEGVVNKPGAARELLGLEAEFQNLHNEGILKKSSAAAFENFLLAKYERFAGVTRTRSYPYVMMIDPSNICQLRCPNCTTGAINEIRRKNHAPLSFARPATRLARDVLDSILEECGDVVFYCHFYNWSEPLLHDGLPEFIGASTERNIYTKIDTNLSLRLSDAKIEALLLSGLGELAASIDGFSQATYEQYRRGGRFALALDNLTRIAAMRDRLGAETRLTWNFILFSFNEHEAADIAAWCKQHNVYFNPKEAVITDSQRDWLPSYRREGKPNPWRESEEIALQSSEWTTPAGPIPSHIGRSETRSCGWHYGYTTVRGDGGVAPCCLLYWNRDDFGEVTAAPGSFGRVWNNVNFAAARRILPGRGATVATYPVAVCSQCKFPEAFLDHYAVLDREIVRSYWRFPEGSDVRRFDDLFTLLQCAPAVFAEAFAAKHHRQTDDSAAAPQSVAMLARLGHALFRENNLSEASAAFERALALDPGDARIPEWLIPVYLKLRRLDDAERHARAALCGAPDNARLHSYLASALKQTGRRTEALDHAKRAAELEPANARYRQYADDLASLIAKSAGRSPSSGRTVTPQ